MGIEIIVDGELREVPPRRLEMIRQLLRADIELDLMEVGEVRFRLSNEKVTMQPMKSNPPGRAAGWSEWRRSKLEQPRE